MALYDVLRFVGLGLLMLVPPFVLMRKYHADWWWFLLGIASWMIAYFGKLFVEVALWILNAYPESALWSGAISGFISAIMELGFAALFLTWKDLRWQNAAAFGVGIGVIEIPFVLFLGWLETLDAPAPPLKSYPFLIEIAVVLERALTMVGHTTSRLLVYLTLRKRQFPAGIFVLFTFALGDGIAVYGTAMNWNWESAQLMGNLLLFYTVLFSIELCAAIYFWRRAHLK